VLDATSAAIATLRAHLLAPLPDELADAGAQSLADLGAAVVEGWPQPEKALAYPTVAVHVPSLGTREPHAPALVKRVDPAQATDPVFDAYLSVADLTLPVVLEVFASSKSQRAQVLASLEAALNTNVVDDDGTLELVAGDYFGFAIGFTKDGPPRFDDTPGRVLAHEWHATLNLTAELDEIVLTKATRLLELRTSTVVWIEGQVPIPAGQSKTIFAP
jgi:hypothetical protein